MVMKRLIPTLVLSLAVALLAAYVIYMYVVLPRETAQASPQASEAPWKQRYNPDPYDRARIYVVGEWQSTIDPQDKLVIEKGGTLSEMYAGWTAEAGETWVLLRTLDKEGDPALAKLPSGIYLKRTGKTGALYYSVSMQNDDALGLTYLARGNTLAFIRVRSIGE